MRLLCSHVQISHFEVNKYSTVNFLVRSVSHQAALIVRSEESDGFSSQLKLRNNQSEESVKVQDCRGSGGLGCSYLALAVPGSISSLSHRTGSEGQRVAVRWRSDRGQS